MRAILGSLTEPSKLVNVATCPVPLNINVEQIYYYESALPFGRGSSAFLKKVLPESYGLDCVSFGCSVPRRSARSFIKAKNTGTRIRT